VAALPVVAVEYGEAVFVDVEVFAVFAHASFPLTLFVMWSIYQP
jgi:hypothetical protein